MRPRQCTEDAGQATAFSVVMASALLLLAAFVFDVGSALAQRSAALHTAQEAARVGAQQIDLALYRTGTVTLEPGQAAAAAEDHLEAAGMRGSATVQGEAVTVTAHTTASFALLPLPERTASGTASATPLTTDAP